MNLQGRHLSSEMHGDDVALLQRELALLGAQLPPEETQHSLFGPATLRAVTEFQASAGLHPTGTVDERTAQAINRAVGEKGGPAAPTSVVHGTVIEASARPAVGLAVRAFDRDLRAEALLGEATTDSAGGYRIVYPPDQRARAEKDSVDLVVRVYGRSVVTSPTLFDAAPDERVDLVLPPSPQAEFTLVAADVLPVAGDVPVADLTEDAQHQDIAYLVGETGRDPLQLTYFVLAHRFARVTGLPAEPFYGLLRQGLPTDLGPLAAQPADQLQVSLTAACEAGIISALSTEDVGRFVAELGTRATAAATAPGSDAPISAVLATTLPDAGLRQRFLTAYLANRAPVTQFWESLRQHPELAGSVDTIQRALQFGALTGNHAPLVEKLVAMHAAGELTDVREVATFTTTTWQRLVEEAGGPPTWLSAQIGAGQDPTAAYLRTLAAIAADAFPTVALTTRLRADPRSAEAPATRFLSANPDFDLRTGNVELAVAAAAGAPEEADALRTGLATLQRVLRLAPRYDQMSLLLADGVHSAYQVTRFGRNAFVTKYGPTMGARSAKLVYERSAQVTATAQNLIAKYHTYNDIEMPSLPSQPTEHPAIPNWENLFGKVDYCACASCRSVTSPAAYLVDLLHWLGDRPSTVAGESAYEVLVDRRPDLADIELSCDNTQLVVPYVDLVTEILEDAVLAAPGYVPPKRQTTGPASELLAEPQHLSPAAYDLLRTAVYPWELPFDLWGAQARGYLGQLGVQRADLMRTLQTTAPSDLEIAAAELGLPTLARRLIAGELPAPCEPQENYGLAAGTAPGWAARFKTVRALLDVTGLAFAELTELLLQRFVNPGGVLTVVPDSPARTDTCDTRHLLVQGLDEAFLDRLHRFVRLQRALGWSARDLDRTLAVFAPGGALTGDTLQEVTAVRRLVARCGLPVERVLAFFGPLDTYRYEDTDLSPYDRVFLTPTVLPLGTDEQSPFTLSTDRSDVAAPPDLTTRDNAAALLAALAVSEAELTALVSGPRKVVTDGHGTLANLSAMLRTVTLAHAAGLSVLDLLRLRDLSGRDPFPGGAALSPAVVNQVQDFLEIRDRLAAYGLSVAEVDAVLTGTADPTAPIIPGDAALGQTLSDLRSALQSVFTEFSDTTDLKGDVSRKWLAMLGWEPTLVDLAVSTLLGAVTYTAPLTNPPTAIPPALAGRVGYDAAAQPPVLSVLGPLTNADRQALLAVQADPAYQAAVKTLYDAPRTFVTGRMQAFVVPTFAAPLAALPTGVTIPRSLARKVFWDPGSLALRSNGYLWPTEHDQLTAVSADPTWTGAVDALVTAQDSYVPDQANRFLGPADATAMFDTPQPPADRLTRLLGILAPYLRRQLTTDTVKQKVGAATGLDPATADGLLGSRLGSPTHTAQLALLDFLAPQFVQSDAAVAVTRTAFPDQFAALTTTYRAAAALVSLRISATQLPWVLGYAAETGWLDLGALQVPTAAATPPVFEAFIRLLDLLQLRDALPHGDRTLGDLLTIARDPATDAAAMAAAICDRTGWDRSDLDKLVTVLNLALPTALKDEHALRRLQQTLALLRRLGVSAERAAGWAAADLGKSEARAIRQAVKAKYSAEEWTGIARALRDPIREVQRAALVAYLRVRPDAAKQQTWTDSNGMFDWFLVDPEMTPCAETTRILLAISSVQTFVNRCLLNLEPEVRAETVADPRWNDWEAMSKYRVWEADRRVFLYPENYLEPFLLPDKSPFFTDLANQLQQAEVTDDTAEAAFHEYVEKLESVAHLEPCGMYHQQESDEHGDIVLDVLHVFGRTKGTPHRYWYRQLVNGNRWTAWQTVDLDIQGDVLIPVVWNRRLYLFWAVFTQVSDQQDVVIPAPGQTLPREAPYWTLQLAWSELRTGKWRARRTTAEFLKTFDTTHNVRPEDHVFKAQFDYASGDLVITVLQFKTSTCKVGTFRFSVCDTSVTVTDLRDLDPRYWIIPPLNTLASGMTFVEDSRLSSGRLYLPRFDGDLSLVFDQTAAGHIQQVQLFYGTPPPGHLPFTVLYPHTYAQFVGQDSFFYSDGNGAFFIAPYNLTGPVHWSLPGNLVLDPNHTIYDKYQSQQGIPDPVGPVEQPPELVVYAGFTPVRSLAKQDQLARPPVTANTAGPLGFLSFGPAGPAATTFNPGAATTQPPAALDSLGLRISADLLQSMPDLSTGLGQLGVLSRHFRFSTFHHPYGSLFLAQLNQHGTDGLLQRTLQLNPDTFQPGLSPFKFTDTYTPTALVDPPYPAEDIDFLPSGAYSLYNWELFFHIPLLLAERLSTNQQFDKAVRWFQTVFDPTDTSTYPAPQRYWRTKPFFDTLSTTYQDQEITELLKRLAEGRSDPDLDQSIKDWRDNPFQPHVVARLRTTAYQKSVVMKYLDNIIGWGDRLLRQESVESVTQATQLYVRAAQLLGRYPEQVPPATTAAPKTFNDLLPHLDTFSNALVAAENLVAPVEVPRIRAGGWEPPPLPLLLYFCVPKNDQLLGYWDLVAGRLFNIRHCLNIAGVEEMPALWEPPIDPMALVRAVAGGASIAEAMANADAPLPLYRFSTMVAKASELCAEVKSLGATLLSTLEKRDAESLGRMRAGHELAVLNAARTVREQQVAEAKSQLAALNRSLALARAKQQYYTSRPFMNDGETTHVELSGAALTVQEVAAGLDLAASIAHIVPNAKVGAPPSLGVTFGGDNVGNMLKGFASSLGLVAGTLNASGSLAATLAGYLRRADDWQFQASQAALEISQLGEQINTATIRVKIAEQELANHDLQITNSSEVSDFLRDKFTNEELYDWMVGELSSIFFGCYQLAYDAAKRAEQCYRNELAVADSAYIQFGYWDSLRKGLLSGERLYSDVKRLESAYLEQNSREYELTKRISLACLDPVALERLRRTGECFVSLPETLFDLDAPGHYMRRIKSLSLSIPCVAGPYTSVTARLTLLSSTVRTDPKLLGVSHDQYVRLDNDPRFRDYIGAAESIVTSTGLEESGMFDLSDDRRRPFERLGAISQWHLKLLAPYPQFARESISDAVWHLRLTARDGGDGLATQVTRDIQTAVNSMLLAEARTGLYRAVSARQEFPAEWARFLNPAPGADAALQITLPKDRFPAAYQASRMSVDTVSVLLPLSSTLLPDGQKPLSVYAASSPLSITLNAPGGMTATGDLSSDAGFLAGTPAKTFTIPAEVTRDAATWTVTMTRSSIAALDPRLRTTDDRLRLEAVEDLVLVLRYHLT